MPEGPLDEAVEQARKALLAGSPAADKFVPLLLGAAEVVCQLHREDRLYRRASDEDDPEACPHGPDQDWDQHFEADDGTWCCLDRPAGSECRCGAEWPCGEYADVLAALTGRWDDRGLIKAELAKGGDGG